MAKTRQQKETTVNDLATKLQQGTAVVFANFAGLKVNEVDQMRRQCRQAQVEYLVAKKTLLKRALAQAGLTGIDLDMIKSGVATVLGYGEVVTPAKILNQFSKDHETLKIVGGLLEGRYIDQVKVNELAQLPGREELLAQAVGSLAAPLSSFVNVLAGNLRSLVYVLQAVKDRRV